MQTNYGVIYLSEIQEETTQTAEEIEHEHYSKVLFQYQGTLIDLLKPLKMYGQAHYVDPLIQELVKLGWQLHWKLEGVDEPFEYEKPTY